MEMIKKEVYDNLPPMLQELTKNFEGREKDIVLLSCLCVLSCCMPNVNGIYGGYTVYSNIYALIIAPPASGKGVMNYSRILIEKINSQIKENSRDLRTSCIEEKKQEKNKDYSLCPSIEMKVIPANISSAKLYEFMNRSQHGILIIESEADTLSNMLKQHWSNYSDVLRKSFHHETISKSRKIDEIEIEVSEPKMSVLLSGTPDQLISLINSKENGLFSRFLIYSFDEIAPFKNVFSPQTVNYKSAFVNAGDVIFELYNQLSSRTSSLNFMFTSAQSELAFKEFKLMHNIIVEELDKTALSNLNRHGLILFRICMILTILRNGQSAVNMDTVYCNDIDFQVGLLFVKSLLKHSIQTSEIITEGYLSKQDDELYYHLGEYFLRKDAIKLAKKYNIPVRTMDDKINQWCKKQLIIKIKHGQYRRMFKNVRK